MPVVLGQVAEVLRQVYGVHSCATSRQRVAEHLLRVENRLLDRDPRRELQDSDPASRQALEPGRGQLDAPRPPVEAVGRAENIE